MGQYPNDSLEVATRHHMRRIWIRGILGLFILVVIGALTIVVLAKTTADTTARNSNSAIIVYLDTIISTAGKNDAPQSIIEAVSVIEKPGFKRVPLGDISSEYRSAKLFYEEAMAKTNEYKRKIAECAQILAFYADYEKLKTEVTSLEASITMVNGKTKDVEYLNKYYALLIKTNELIEKTTVASDYADEFVELGRVYDSRELNMEAIITSLKQKNEIAYTNMYEIYNTASAQRPRVDAALGIYVKSVPDKIKAALDELKNYKGSL
ncbi:MAG: hypothetical protein ACOH18_01360 [Candidatus Saccharimonadaceae bacterium]